MSIRADKLQVEHGWLKRVDACNKCKTWVRFPAYTRSCRGERSSCRTSGAARGASWRRPRCLPTLLSAEPAAPVGYQTRSMKSRTYKVLSLLSDDNQIWEFQTARSRLYRRRFLQGNTKYLLERSWRDLQDLVILHVFCTAQASIFQQKQSATEALVVGNDIPWQGQLFWES